MRVWPRDVKHIGTIIRGGRVEARYQYEGTTYTVQSAHLCPEALRDPDWRARWVFDMHVALSDHLSGKKTHLVLINHPDGDFFQLPGTC